MPCHIVPSHAPCMSGWLDRCWITHRCVSHGPLSLLTYLEVAGVAEAVARVVVVLQHLFVCLRPPAVLHSIQYAYLLCLQPAEPTVL